MGLAKLLPDGLFSAYPGLLTVKFTSLPEEVHQVLKQMPTMVDVCALSVTKLWMPGMIDGLIKVWQTALTQVCLSSDAQLPISWSLSDAMSRHCLGVLLRCNWPEGMVMHCTPISSKTGFVMSLRSIMSYNCCLDSPIAENPSIYIIVE